MPRPELLSPEAIQFKMNKFQLWSLEGNTIVRELSASNFASAVGLINSIAIAAEVLDHHPDILLYGWNKLRITLTTHDRGGLTDLDFELANKIEEIYSN